VIEVPDGATEGSRSVCTGVKLPDAGRPSCRRRMGAGSAQQLEWMVRQHPLAAARAVGELQVRW